MGLGYDIHRLAPGRRLVLGGVALDHPQGLVGHSDGDVLLHAVMDALLGAAALGDLGSHFPGDDPAYAGADSLDLLRGIATKVRDAGYAISSVDVTVICEAPRLAAHVVRMRDSVAAAIGVDAGLVSVKAKTNEGLGETGAGRAMAAMAVALVTR